MSKPKPIPEALYNIPDDATPEEKLYMRAQMVIQAAFYAFGDPDERPGAVSLGTDELIEVLNFATAMLLSTDESLRTRQAIRKATQEIERRLRVGVEVLQGDSTTQEMLDYLGMTSSKPH